MKSVLVTGGTGTLGTPTVHKLHQGGHSVRILSRRRADGLTTGDLLSGEGLREAVDAIDCVAHLATGGGRSDIVAIGNLLSAVRDAKVSHFVLISIVGIDAIPVRFYRQRLAIERAVMESSVPFTILRSTQFHSFVDGFFERQRLSPVLAAPAFSYQSIDVSEVAARLAALAVGPPQGRVPDIGGPQRLSAREMAVAWRNATGIRRAILPVWAPGRAFRAMATGHNLVPAAPFGRRTFDSYLESKYAQTGTR